VTSLAAALRVSFMLASAPHWLRVSFMLASAPHWLRVKLIPNFF
jgi:hypothetical protein